MHALPVFFGLKGRQIAASKFSAAWLDCRTYSCNGVVHGEVPARHNSHLLPACLGSKSMGLRCSKSVSAYWVCHPFQSTWATSCRCR